MATSNKVDVLQQLRDGITELTNSDAWQRYLDVQGRFHNYSWGNSLLIARQCPDATRVAGYRKWQALGRQVRKGERAIMILAPLVYKTKEENDTATETAVVRGFRSVAVFDVAQTDGEPLPEIAKRLQGSDPVFAFRRLERVAGELNYHVAIEPMNGAKNGECRFVSRVIAIRSGIAPAQMVKTMAHELGHVVLHNPEEQRKRSVDRPTAELEAESVAYVVCRELGIDSGSYSFG
jgi:antirestriction protein ArdC